jgi:hypothetical protein
MIPKIIHYCWFGNSQKSQLNNYCIESWKKLCPDYEIVEWNESNYDIQKNKYMYDAYLAGKWGFVSDYARLDIIYNEGGIYLDTDVELLKNLDSLLTNRAYFGFEIAEGKDGLEPFIATGLGFGAEKGNEVVAGMRSCYDNLSFYDETGTMQLIPCPVYNTQYLMGLGFVRKDCIQQRAGVQIYPHEYFAPKNYITGKLNLTPNTISIHHYNGSWISNRNYIKKMVKRLILNTLGERTYNKIKQIKANKE